MTWQDTVSQQLMVAVVVFRVIINDQVESCGPIFRHLC
jgi:hypothetical protein